MTEKRDDGDVTDSGAMPPPDASAPRAADATAVLMELLATFDAQQRRRDAIALAESARPVPTRARA